MKRFLSLILVAAMLAVLAAVPAATANNTMVFSLRPAQGTPAELKPGDVFTMEVYIDDPQNRLIGSISELKIAFNPAILEWEYQQPANRPFTFRKQFDVITPDLIYDDPAFSPTGLYNARINFASVAILDVSATGVLMEFHFKVKSTAHRGVSPVSITLLGVTQRISGATSDVGLTAGTDFRAESGSISIDSPIFPPTRYPVTVNGSVTGSYMQGENVPISAGNPPGEGFVFSHWTSSPGGLGIRGAETATFAMPGEPVTLTANWNEPAAEIYPVSIDGILFANRKEGDTVNISVGDNAGTGGGQVFTGWQVASGGVTLADAARTSTSFVMPANAVSLATNWSSGNIGDGDGDGVPGELPDLDNFKRIHIYYDGIFSDLPQNPEAAEWIIKAFEYGIIAGIGNGLFGSGNNMLVQEAVTIAAKMHMIYYDGAAADLSYPDGYIAYAKEENLIGNEFDGAYNRAATRAELVRIWAYILLPDDMKAQNDVVSLPDVNTGSTYYSEIISFYKAGILTGVDSAGTFSGSDNVIRAHAAVMFVKLVETNLRTKGRAYGL
jgi:hypothetical protein